MRLIRAADCRVMPWKNGGGSTTEIAVHPAGASLDDFDWRISMAHVGADGPFSLFPGIDRTLCVLNGAGLDLAFADGELVSLTSGSEPFAFAADRPVAGRLRAGPIDDLNVMTRRGCWRHRVRRLSASADLTHDGDLAVLVARDGGWLISSGEDEALLGADDAVLIDGTVGSCRVSREGPGALFAIEFRRIGRR